METITQEHGTFCLKNTRRSENDRGWCGDNDKLIHLAQEYETADDAVNHCAELNAEIKREGLTSEMHFEVYCKRVVTEASLLADVIEAEKEAKNNADSQPLNTPW